MTLTLPGEIEIPRSGGRTLPLDPDGEGRASVPLGHDVPLSGSVAGGRGPYRVRWETAVGPVRVGSGPVGNYESGTVVAWTFSALTAGEHRLSLKAADAGMRDTLGGADATLDVLPPDAVTVGDRGARADAMSNRDARGAVLVSYSEIMELSVTAGGRPLGPLYTGEVADLQLRMQIQTLGADGTWSGWRTPEYAPEGWWPDRGARPSLWFWRPLSSEVLDTKILPPLTAADLDRLKREPAGYPFWRQRLKIRLHYPTAEGEQAFTSDWLHFEAVTTENTEVGNGRRPGTMGQFIDVRAWTPDPAPADGVPADGAPATNGAR